LAVGSWQLAVGSWQNQEKRQKKKVKTGIFSG
jgi:hypothetical protein